MKQSEENPTALIIEKLANGIELHFFDRSRLVAGDRWQVKLECEATIPITEAMWARVENEDTSIFNGVREKLGKSLTFSFTRTRNFVDDRKKQESFDEFVQRVKENMLDYLANPNFPQLLFDQRYAAARKEYLLAEQVRRNDHQQSCKPDDGPADFSACFK